MKKVIWFLTALILLSIVTNAQKSSAKCFDENTKLLNFGIGLGSSYYEVNNSTGYSHRNFPSISLSYEQTYPKRLGPGYMGVGAYLAYKGSSYKYDYSYAGSPHYYEHNYRNYTIASRAAYHWDGLVFEKGDVYGGVILGVRVETDNYVTNDPALTGGDNSSFHVTYSLFAGARYYFAPKFAVFGEIGYGISYLTGGITYKL